jgi:lipopolysaccharide/colanic/teichoic acid biosynthesis glycosyltransferase
VGFAQAMRFEPAADTTAAVSVVIAVLWMGALGVYRTRESRLLGRGLEEYRRVGAATLTLFAGIALLSYVFKLEINRSYLVFALPLGLVALLANRRVVRHIMGSRRRKQGLVCPVLAIGTADSVRALKEDLALHPEEGYTVVDSCGAGGISDLSAYLSGDDFMAAVLESGAGMVVITSSHLSDGQIRDLSWHLERFDVDVALIHIEKPQYEAAKRFRKRLFDVAFSAAALLLTAPLLALVALAIKLEDYGPVFYVSDRIGLEGRRFRMLKFRTMAVGADQRIAEVAHLDEGNGVLFKIRSDPRVTRVGRFLRRYSIDEIPQFVNVLRRDMSVVGPRPPLPSEASAYDDQMWRRLLVRPGITGLWQISGRSDLSWEDSVRLDLSYVENWSMTSDLVIAAKTVSVVRRGSGAY